MNSSTRETNIGGWLLLAGGVLFAAAQLVMAWLSNVPSDPARLLDWAEGHFPQLFFVDEALAFAVPILTVGMILLYRYLRSHSPVSALAGVVAYGVAAVAYITVTLALGRLIYPVNGLPMSTDGVLMAISQVFAGMHFAAIALGVAIVAIGVALRQRALLVLSIVVGVLQVVGTYYGTTPPFWLLALAIGAWVVWIVAVGQCMLKSRKQGT